MFGLAAAETLRRGATEPARAATHGACVRRASHRLDARPWAGHLAF